MLIRSLTREDLPQVAELLATRDGVGTENAVKRTAILEWIAFQNPYAEEGEPRYFVAEEEGKVVALHGRMPVLFSIKGEYHRGYYVHDLSVHRDSLKKGQGLWLTLALAKAIEEGTESFFCLVGMTPLNQQMQRRRHYHEMFADSYVKVFRPREILPIIVQNRLLANVLALPLRLGLAIADWFVLRPSPYLPELTRISIFDERFDRLFARVAGKLNICSVKNSAYLRWKYGEGPCREDAVLAYISNDEVRGFVVVGCIQSRGVPVGVIKEIIADPDEKETVLHLFKSAVRFLRDQRVSAILCILTEERFVKQLKKLIFFRRTNHEPIFLGNLNKVNQHKEMLSDIRNWHMMFGESDLFMFGRDRSSI